MPPQKGGPFGQTGRATSSTSTSIALNVVLRLIR